MLQGRVRAYEWGSLRAIPELFGKAGDMDEVNTDGGGDRGHALNNNPRKVLAKVESTFLKSEA